MRQGWVGEKPGLFEHPAKPYPNHSFEGNIIGQLHLRPDRGELLPGKTDQLLKSRGILNRHIG
jgi:hypothetical protein